MTKTQNLKHKSKIRIAVGMSGGVDSSVTAVLLKKQGYDVIGVFLKFWQPPAAQIDTNKCTNKHECENTCCDQEALLQARKVASILDIPFYVLDVSKEFKRKVVDYYIDEYQNGRTPNPCVECNKFIKFGWLLDKAKELGADFIATGHYAKINRPTANSYQLTASKDKQKDQTYFLWQLDQNQLKHVIFPLGGYQKPEVRELARKFKLPVAEKKESQGICFIPDRDNVGFLSRYIKKLIMPGKIVDINNNVLGKHKGLGYYTIGQRHGLEGVQLKVGGGIPPAYVIKLNIDKNELIIGEEKDLYSKELIAEKVNWIDSHIAYRISHIAEISCRAKIRYGHPAESCKLLAESQDKIKIIFEKSQRAITPGQSIVFYLPREAPAKGGQKNILIIGGGVIK